MLLENSLRGSGDHLRVTVQLLQVKDQSHLWGQDYDYRPRDILSLEDDVAKAVAREIQIRLSPQQQADLTRARPVNPEAFDAYMEGRFFLDRDSAGDLNSRRKLLRAGDPTGFQLCRGLGRVVSGPLSPGRQGLCSP